MSNTKSTLSPSEQQGHDFAKGFFHYVFSIAWAWFIVILLFIVIRGFTGFDMDDSDADSWHRSGFKIMIDARTGFHYLSDGKGGLVLRRGVNTPSWIPEGEIKPSKVNDADIEQPKGETK